mgnify:CR=1 FL=1
MKKDGQTQNKFFIEFKGPYIEALERRHRSPDKNTDTEVDYEAYKERVKNEKSQKWKQAKRFSDYLEKWGKKDILPDRGNIRNISDKPGQDKKANK